MSGKPLNSSETINTLKCVSEPGGTLCMYDSLTVSMWEGLRALFNLSIIVDSTGPPEKSK